MSILRAVFAPRKDHKGMSTPSYAARWFLPLCLALVGTWAWGGDGCKHRHVVFVDGHDRYASVDHWMVPHQPGFISFRATVPPRESRTCPQSQN